MRERSIKCALWLKKQGVKPGDIIGLCTDNNLDAVIVLLGIMSLNGKCNTWDHILSLSVYFCLLLLLLTKIRIKQSYLHISYKDVYK